MENGKKKFYMLVGLPGSGKSTWAESQNMEIISSDYWIEQVAAEIEKTYSDVFDNVVGPANKMVEALLSMGSYMIVDMILDQTNLSVKSRARKLELLNNKEEYHKVAMYFNTPLSVINHRLAERNKEGKVISSQLIEKMASLFERPTVEEGFDEVNEIEFKLN